VEASKAIPFTVLLFVLAGLCEIGGGWMMWKWLRDAQPLWWGLVGAAILILYGVIPTFQPSHFGRVYAAYGGFFIALSLLWGALVDGDMPDRWDLMGGAIAIIGVSVIMYAPRTAAN